MKKEPTNGRILTEVVLYLVTLWLIFTIGYAVGESNGRKGRMICPCELPKR